MDRIKQLASHLSGSSTGPAALHAKHADDVVITMAIRSPLCKAKKGGFKDARYLSPYSVLCSCAADMNFRTDELLLELFNVRL